MAICNDIERIIAPTRYILFQRGNESNDSFSDKELIALNISTTTRIDNEIDVAFFAK
jgi:hypothetical protein